MYQQKDTCSQSYFNDLENRSAHALCRYRIGVLTATSEPDLIPWDISHSQTLSVNPLTGFISYLSPNLVIIYPSRGNRMFLTNTTFQSSLSWPPNLAGDRSELIFSCIIFSASLHYRPLPFSLLIMPRYRFPPSERFLFWSIVLWLAHELSQRYQATWDTTWHF